jgi:single-strand DNA-binding protein
MASYNKVILMGRLTADPEMKQTPAGGTVTNFNVAVDRRFNKGAEKAADFIPVVAFKETAEFICKYFTKGKSIIIDGSLVTRSWTDKDGNKRYGMDVVAREVTFGEPKGDSEGKDTASTANSAHRGFTGITQAFNTAPSVEYVEVNDDNLPF